MNIKAKIIGIFALATLLVMSACGAFFYVSNRAAMSADLSASAQSMAQRLSRSLATPLAEKNKQQAASILGAEMLERTVSAVIVREADGKKVFTGLRRDAQGGRTEALHAPEGDCIKASMPVQSDRVKAGSVDVYLTRAYLRQALAEAVVKLAVMIILLAAVLSAVLYASIELLLVRPLNKVLSLARAVAKGDVSIAIDVRQNDEVGELAQAMTTMAENFSTLVMSSVAIAGGDLTTKVAPLSSQDALGWALKGMVEMLSENIMEIGTAAGNVAAGSGQMNSVSQAMSQDATEQASLLEEISSSMNEIAAQTILNAENASQANKLAGETKMLAERGNERMDRMMSSMKGINEAAKSISKIIKVIDEIAFQTNLLALNAAVEAARAGRHGKGFAVVAEEVRTLAARSAKAARETAELIESAVRTVDGGADLAASTAAALKEIMSAATKMTDIVGEIAAASNEQAQGVTQINMGLGHVDKVTQQNTAHAEESAAAAQELSSQAVMLQQLVSSFQVCETTAPGPSQA